MKFELGNNDCEPCVVVTKVGGELVVMFEGFAHDEAVSWFNSKDAMNSFEVWHEVMGDFEMMCKQIKRKGLEMDEIKRMLDELHEECEENLKCCPPIRESDRVNYYELDSDEVISLSHFNGEVIFDDDVVEEGGIECIHGKNLTVELFESALGDKGFHEFLKQWCEEEHCTRALISRVDPGTRSTA